MNVHETFMNVHERSWNIHERSFSLILPPTFMNVHERSLKLAPPQIDDILENFWSRFSHWHFDSISAALLQNIGPG